MTIKCDKLMTWMVEQGWEIDEGINVMIQAIERMACYYGNKDQFQDAQNALNTAKKRFEHLEEFLEDQSKRRTDEMADLL